MLMENLKLLVFSVVGLDGKINKAIGDAFLITFATPSLAIQAARKLRMLLAERNKLYAHHQVHIKIGIDAGEVAQRAWELQKEDEVFGPCVVTAKRLCDQAKGGEIVISQTVRDMVGTEALESRYEVRARRVKLRNIDNPQDVFLID